MSVTRGGRSGVVRWAALALMLGAVTARAEGPERVQLSRFRGSNALMQRQADAMTEAVDAELEAAGVTRVGRVDLAALPGQQVLGRSEEPAPGVAGPQPCEAEDGLCLARAVPDTGASWLVLGHVVGGGQVRQLDVQVVHLPDGVLAWRNGQATSERADLAQRVGEVVMRVLQARGFKQVVSEGLARLEPVTPPAPIPSATHPRDAAWITASLGAGIVLAGAVVWLVDSSHWANLHSPVWRAERSPARILDETNTFNTLGTAGTVLLATGGAVAVAGLVWALLTPDAPPAAVRLAPLHGGVALVGTW